MDESIKRFLQRWAITTFGVLIATSVVKGIECQSFGTLLIASLVLGVLNAFLRPVLVLFSLPLVIFSLGIFVLVINAVLLYIAGALVPGFEVRSLWSAFWGSLVISLISLIANFFIGTHRVVREMEILEEEDRRRRRLPPNDRGPWIDI